MPTTGLLKAQDVGRDLECRIPETLKYAELMREKLVITSKKRAPVYEMHELRVNSSANGSINTGVFNGAPADAHEAHEAQEKAKRACRRLLD